MKRASPGAALAAAIVITALSAGITQAAPAFQDEPPPTSTPTPTATGFGPTPTPSPTLSAPPQGGGLVTVRELAVRLGPDESDTPLGGLAYGTVVYPIGRSANGNWAAINYQNNVGFIFASLVLWHPNVDILGLPILIPPFVQTPTFGVGTVTGGTLGPTDTSTPRPDSTQTPEPISTTPAALPVTEHVAELPDSTHTLVPAAAEPDNLPPTQSDADLPEGEPSFSLPVANILPWVLIGVPLALLGFYGWQFAAGERERRRYNDSFPMQFCPVCQSGTLSLESVIRRPLGIAHITRTVRCDTCRSVLRQVEPGVWRYAIDRYVNPDLAKDYDSRQLNDEELKLFPITASGYVPAQTEFSADVPPPLTDEEILAELEASIPPPEEIPSDNAAASQETAEEIEVDEPDSEDQTTTD